MSHTTPVTGELRRVETVHPNGTKISAYVLFNGEGKCVHVEEVEGGFTDVPLRDVHIVLDESRKVDLKKLLGATVTVKGEMQLSTTAWHIGSLIMFDAKILSARDIP